MNRSSAPPPVAIRRNALSVSGWRRPVRCAVAAAIAGSFLLLACSRQEEGDRCSTENDDLDCESGLICVPARNLRASDEVPRCCPPEGEPISNGLCAPDVVVRDAAWADADFSARFSATARTYHYDVWNEATPHPLLAHTTWHVPKALDVEAMNAAAATLVGEHDFSSFCRRPKPAPGMDEPSMVRHLQVARWHAVDSEWDGRLLRFEITASSFCHQMVRSIVGTMVEVGHGKKRAGDMTGILRARDRSVAGQLAPPHGLCLWEVQY